MTRQQLAHPTQTPALSDSAPAHGRQRLAEFLVVDLFCGGGGTLTGTLDALAEVLHELGLSDLATHVIAVNHEPDAIATIRRNHPNVEAVPCDLETTAPASILLGRLIGLLLSAAPCQEWSNAAAGPCVTKQPRATPDYSKRWRKAGRPLVYVEENVREVRKRWPGWAGHVRSIKREGYHVEVRDVNAADYGTPQDRKRQILIAIRKDAWGKRARVPWAAPTHSKNGSVPGTRPWVGANTCIDFTRETPSIFGRPQRGKKPYSRKVRARLAKHIRDEGGRFYEILAREVEKENGKPVPLARALAACPPTAWPAFILERPGTEFVRLKLMHFVLGQQGGHSGSGEAQPLPVVPTAGFLRAVDISCVVPPQGPRGGPMSNKVRSVRDVLNCITATRGQHIRLAEVRFVAFEPAIIPAHGERQRRHGRGRAQKARYHATSRPLPAIPASRHLDVAIASVYTYNGVAQVDGVEEPLTTIATGDRHALVEVRIDDCYLDVGMRQFTIEELAAGQTFPTWYVFEGTSKRARSRQIGNAVPCRLSHALTKPLLRECVQLHLQRVRTDDYDAPTGVTP